MKFKNLTPQQRKKILGDMLDRMQNERVQQGQEPLDLHLKRAYVFFLIQYEVDALTLAPFGKSLKNNVRELADMDILAVAPTQQVNVFVYPVEQANESGFIDEQCALIKSKFAENPGVVKVTSVTVTSLQYLSFFEAMEQKVMNEDPLFTTALWPGDRR